MTPDSPALNIQQLTLEAWVYFEGMNEPTGLLTPGAEWEAPILSKAAHLGYYLRLVGDDRGRVFADLSVAGKFSVGRAGFVPRRKWTHIAATYNGREAQIYLNGLAVPSERDAHYEGTVHADGAPLVIGCRDPDAPDKTSFPGFIGEVRVWNRVLSPGVIHDEAHLRLRPDDAPGLVGSWSFQTVTGDALPDLSGGGHTFEARHVQRVLITNGPLARPLWRYGELNLLESVTVDRASSR